jgi:hypothetical protein
MTACRLALIGISNSVPVFILSDTHRATLYVLRTHATNVTAALPGVKQQRER